MKKKRKSNLTPKKCVPQFSILSCPFLALPVYFQNSQVAKWLRLLTRMQEDRGSNPGAAPPKHGAQTPPYPASRVAKMHQGSPSPPKGAMWGGVRWKPSTREDTKKTLTRRSSSPSFCRRRLGTLSCPSSPTPRPRGPLPPPCCCTPPEVNERWNIF